MIVVVSNCSCIIDNSEAIVANFSIYCSTNSPPLQHYSVTKYSIYSYKVTPSDQ